MFDVEALAATIATHGPTARIVIAAHEGSSPREVGAAMLVWPGGQSGTIGGGALEWQAIATARALLVQGGSRVDRHALGPALGQCCGGAVTLLTEVYAAAPQGKVIARSTDGRPMPLAVKRLLAQARGQGRLPPPQLMQGWMIEPVTTPQRQLWIWGAGHVGRAIVGVLSPLPGLSITWVDVAPDRFPGHIPENTRALPVQDPGLAVTLSPPDAEHLILTYCHALDLDLCHRLLTHGFAGAGLIGSATKWARFRSRLAALGHSPASIARMQCPIGHPALGKHPQAIAIGVAGQFLDAKQSSRLQEIAG